MSRFLNIDRLGYVGTLFSKFFDYGSQFGPWDWWSFYWLVIWFGLGFGIPETYALATHHPEHTLSDQVWRMEAMSGWAGLVLHIVLAIGFGWLFFHMVFRLFRG